MNGFTLMADSYRKAAEQGKISREQAERECRIFDFLGTCDHEDIYRLFDSSAFNEIVESYLHQAVRELVDEGTINEKQEKAVKNRFTQLFDERTAKEVCEK